MEQDNTDARTPQDPDYEDPAGAAIDPDIKIAKLEADLKQKATSVEALNDRLLRLQAEFENYKKRMARERSEFMKFANEGLILECLPVLDNLERAVATARSSPEAQGVTEGLEIILRLFQATLEKAGVKPIVALEHEFDPNLQQAVAQVGSTDGRDNLVVEEVRKGYLLEGRVLRPSLVKVARAIVPPSEPRVSRVDEGESGNRNL